MKALFTTLILALLLYSGCATTSTQCDQIANISAESARFICQLIGTLAQNADSVNMLQGVQRTERKDKLLSDIAIVSKYLNNQAENSHMLSEYFQQTGRTVDVAQQEKRAEVILLLRKQLEQIADKVQ